MKHGRSVVEVIANPAAYNSLVTSAKSVNARGESVLGRPRASETLAFFFSNSPFHLRTVSSRTCSNTSGHKNCTCRTHWALVHLDFCILCSTNSTNHSLTSKGARCSFRFLTGPAPSTSSGWSNSSMPSSAAPQDSKTISSAGATKGFPCFHHTGTTLVTISSGNTPWSIARQRASSYCRCRLGGPRPLLGSGHVKPKDAAKPALLASSSAATAASRLLSKSDSNSFTSRDRATEGASSGGTRKRRMS